MEDCHKAKRVCLKDPEQLLREAVEGLDVVFEGVWSEEQRDKLTQLQAQANSLLQEELRKWMHRDRFLELQHTAAALVELYHEIYIGTLHLIQSSERDDLNQLQQIVKEIGTPAPQARQWTEDLPTLMCDGYRTKNLLYDPFIEQIAQDTGTMFGRARLKGLRRCMEKASRGNGNALMDIVRGLLCSRHISQLAHSLQILQNSNQIHIIRVKNRFQHPNESGWADCLVNFVFTQDQARHICEVQLIHEKMMLVRKPMGAHANYSQFRGAVEIMEQIFRRRPEVYVCLSIHQGCVVQNHRLDLRGTELTGRVPTSLRYLTTLRSLDLSGNKLTGPIPTIFSELLQLHTLNLCNNRLVGTIPECISQLPRLSDFLFSGNQSLVTDVYLEERFSIAVQTHALSMLYQTTHGDHWKNRRSWVTEYWSCILWYGVQTEHDSGNIQKLYLNNNQLRGCLHESIGLLRYLQVLQLSNNQLTGKIPQSIGQLTALQQLDLSRNQLTGIAPECLTDLTNLHSLNLEHNPCLSAVVCFRI